MTPLRTLVIPSAIYKLYKHINQFGQAEYIIKMHPKAGKGDNYEFRGTTVFMAEAGEFGEGKIAADAFLDSKV